MRDNAPLDDLPKVVAAVGRAAINAGDHFAWASINDTLNSHRGGAFGNTIAGVSLHTSLRISRDARSRVFLWFGRRDTGPRITVDADIRATLAPAPVASRHEPIDEITRVFVDLPGFFRQTRSGRDYERFTSLLRGEASPANTLLVQLPAGVVASFCAADDNGEFDYRDARLQYTPINGQPIVLRSSADVDLLLPVFLDIVATLGRWASGKTAEHRVAIDSNTLNRNTDVVKVLAAFVTSYTTLRTQCVRTVVSDGWNDAMAVDVSRWTQHFVNFDPVVFSADLTLRLNHKGNFAQANEDNPFELGLTAAVNQTPGHLDLSLVLQLPGFVTEHAAKEPFLAELADNNLVEKLTTRLGASRRDMRRLVHGNPVAPVLLRLHRRVSSNAEVDDFLIVWRWTKGDLDLAVVTFARFRTDADGNVDLRKVRLEHAGPVVGARDRLGDELIEYLAKLTTALQRWSTLGLQR